MNKFKVGDKVKYTLKYYNENWRDGDRLIKGIITEIISYCDYEVSWSDGIVNNRPEHILESAIPEINEQKLKAALGLKNE